ncbi:MAG: hypothetical protein ACFFBD_08845 [Candidatus Hodarchaeota archaeon]
MGSMIKLKEGERVTLTGKLSDVLYQHLMGAFEGYPEFDYFEPDDSDQFGAQILLYVKKKIDYKGRIKITGKVVALTPAKGSKAYDENEPDYKEFQILVNEWEPIKT